jgi:hypothetical protein
MARNERCRDCSKCKERGLTGLIKKTANATLVVGTLGGSAIASKAAHSVRQTCPVCGHPVSRHEKIDGRFMD